MLSAAILTDDDCTQMVKSMSILEFKPVGRHANIPNFCLKQPDKKINRRIRVQRSKLGGHISTIALSRKKKLLLKLQVQRFAALSYRVLSATVVVTSKARC